LGKDFIYNKNKIIPSDMPIVVYLDVMLARRKMTLTELSEKVGITIANLSILKSGKARAIRFSTLEEICHILDCQPGDILEYMSDEAYRKLMRG
jgi:putative transcriptional regulator